MKRKLMLVLTCAALILASLAFVACDNKTELNDPRANANVLVVDAYMQPITGAKVTLGTTVDGQSVTTNEDGIATLKNLKAGSYAAKVSSDNYASVFVDFSISIGTEGDTPVASADTTLAVLPHLGSSLTGKVEILKGGKYVPLQNAKLNTVGSGPVFQLAQTHFETTSDADGNYTFTNLPEGTSFTLGGATYTDDNVVYTADPIASGVTTNFFWAGTSTVFSVLQYEPEAGQFVVTSGKYPVMSAKNTPIVVDFSHSVDLTKLDSSDINVYETGGYSILVDKIWSDNNKRLTIVPVSGAWDCESVTVNLYSDILSTQGVELRFAEIILEKVTSNALANVGAITLTDDSNMHDLNDTDRDVLELTWTAVTGASGYEVFFRFDDTSAYSYFDTISQPTGTTTTVTFDTTSMGLSASAFAAEGDMVEFIVYAINGNGGRSQKGTVVTINTIPLDAPVAP